MSVTTLIDPGTDLDLADLADRALVAAAELPVEVRDQLEQIPLCAVTLLLAQGIPTSRTAWARLEKSLLVIACKDASLLDDALGLLHAA